MDTGVVISGKGYRINNAIRSTLFFFLSSFDDKLTGTSADVECLYYSELNAFVVVVVVVQFFKKKNDMVLILFDRIKYENMCVLDYYSNAQYSTVHLISCTTVHPYVHSSRVSIGVFNLNVLKNQIPVHGYMNTVIFLLIFDINSKFEVL